MHVFCRDNLDSDNIGFRQQLQHMCCEIASAFQILQRGQISMRRKQTVTATYRSTSVLAETNVLGLCDPVDCSPPVRPTRLGTSKKRLSPFVKGLHECGKFFSAPKMLLLFLVTQPCPTLCNPVDSSPPGSPVRGILQARYWSGLPCPPPGDLPDPGIEPASPTLQAGSIPSEPPGTPAPKMVQLIRK